MSCISVCGCVDVCASAVCRCFSSTCWKVSEPSTDKSPRNQPHSCLPRSEPSCPLLLLPHQAPAKHTYILVPLCVPLLNPVIPRQYNTTQQHKLPLCLQLDWEKPEGAPWPRVTSLSLPPSELQRGIKSHVGHRGQRYCAHKCSLRRTHVTSSRLCPLWWGFNVGC